MLLLIYSASLSYIILFRLSEIVAKVHRNDGRNIQIFNTELLARNMWHIRFYSSKWMEANTCAWYSCALGVGCLCVRVFFFLSRVAHLRMNSILYYYLVFDRTPALSSPAQTENGSGNNQRSSKAIRRRPPIVSGGGGGGPGGSLKLGTPMKLQRIVTQSPAEDFETLTAEAPQRSRSDPMASVSTGGGGMGERTSTARAPRKFSRDGDNNDKPGFTTTTSGGRYARGRLANSNSGCGDGRFASSFHGLLCVRL